MLEFLKNDQQFVESHGLCIASNKIKFKRIRFIVSSSFYYQLFRIFWQSTHLINNLAKGLFADYMSARFTCFDIIELHQFEQTVIFIAKSKPKLLKISLAVRAMKFIMAINNLRNALLTKSMPTHQIQRKPVTVIEGFIAYSTFEIVDNILFIVLLHK